MTSVLDDLAASVTLHAKQGGCSATLYGAVRRKRAQPRRGPARADSGFGGVQQFMTVL